MRRTITILAATAIAAAAAAAIATAGSAQERAGTTLHIVATHQTGIGFGPSHKPRQGDTLGFGDRISGDETGFDRGTCTFIGAHGLKCDVFAQLSGGDITASGIFGRGPVSTFVVTGGTGSYDGARGTAVVTQHAKTTDIAFTLLP